MVGEVVDRVACCWVRERREEEDAEGLCRTGECNSRDVSTDDIAVNGERASRDVVEKRDACRREEQRGSDMVVKLL
jgi:hypothetical protein